MLHGHNDSFSCFIELDNENNINQDYGSGQASNTFEHVNVILENSSDNMSRVRTI